jgi:hypothetical protein
MANRDNCNKHWRLWGHNHEFRKHVERVAGWYGGYGAVPLLDAPLSLLLPLATIEGALGKAGKV